MKTLSETARDQIYTRCANAVTEAGAEAESLFLARLAMLLFERLADERVCIQAIDAALHDLPKPSLSAIAARNPTSAHGAPHPDHGGFHMQASRDSTEIREVSCIDAVPIQGLHHFAWRCRDAEETRQFYEDVLGLPLVHVIRKDNVPSTGEYCPYVHIFFRMFDGSHMAFFDLGDGHAAQPSANTPAWVNHIALRVENRQALDVMHRRLIGHGVDVIGVTDHDQYIESIYFFDPNGFRVELTTEVASRATVHGYARVAHAELARWNDEKGRRAAQGGE